ncbi:unnamed protein product [Microthlaspi erraticum]|uniref:Major facilitator superfamily (MFS) profile domain-containing protein n=1 Tax=Microthlaspi erraticum TaxID=1685480 RepID=A0A6D2I8C4_9BRAS|nr:unnamed protein product [Microthlaspi erraticum]
METESYYDPVHSLCVRAHVALWNSLPCSTRFLEGSLSLHIRSSSYPHFHSICLYFFALESPRWLHLQGKNEEAIQVLKKISPAKRGYLESVSYKLSRKETLEQAPNSSIKDLFTRKWAFEES